MQCNARKYCDPHAVERARILECEGRNCAHNVGSIKDPAPGVQVRPTSQISVLTDSPSAAKNLSAHDVRWEACRRLQKLCLMPVLEKPRTRWAPSARDTA